MRNVLADRNDPQHIPTVSPGYSLRIQRIWCLFNDSKKHTQFSETKGTRLKRGISIQQKIWETWQEAVFSNEFFDLDCHFPIFSHGTQRWQVWRAAGGVWWGWKGAVAGSQDFWKGRQDFWNQFIDFKAGWWLGTFFIFPYIGNNHPNRLIFFRGVQTTNQSLILRVVCHNNLGQSYPDHGIDLLVSPVTSGAVMISDACTRCIKILAHFINTFCSILASPFVGKLPGGWSIKSNNSICSHLGTFFMNKTWQEYAHTHTHTRLEMDQWSDPMGIESQSHVTNQV